MSTLIAISFQHGGTPHSALILVIDKPQQTEYHVTLMDPELERILYGNNVIVEKNGVLQTDIPGSNIVQHELREEIIVALTDHLIESGHFHSMETSSDMSFRNP